LPALARMEECMSAWSPPDLSAEIVESARALLLTDGFFPTEIARVSGAPRPRRRSGVTSTGEWGRGVLGRRKAFARATSWPRRPARISRGTP
jgi:hypothetical protein